MRSRLAGRVRTHWEAAGARQQRGRECVRAEVPTRSRGPPETPLEVQRARRGPPIRDPTRAGGAHALKGDPHAARLARLGARFNAHLARLHNPLRQVHRNHAPVHLRPRARARACQDSPRPPLPWTLVQPLMCMRLLQRAHRARRTPTPPTQNTRPGRRD